ncbi:hypothetical protein [Algoriphagus sp. A40]|uniref:hypothetical protein n=1 Tax=Algoriphagus sp. A40 TaxID=1945863 RepID=UPI000984132D|nr:hypothetical protein [Algoriphagus sp. A40]OOG74252.1 hypothetical protein B0E43_11620 [Algoriphagus sp. A40]
MSDNLPNAQWKKNPENQEWNDPKNWKWGKVPLGKALFSSSRQSHITFSKQLSAEIQSIEFDEAAGGYILLVGTSESTEKLLLTISGEGVINRSGRPQLIKIAATNSNFRDPQVKFSSKATAGGDDMYYESGPESLENGYGGGILGFTEQSDAGSANFIVRTGKQAPPDPKIQRSTVGGEVSFSDHSRAGTAKFTIYGSLGTDGDTFGNTVFHDYASADRGTFINIGGTVEGGDGGNTQFYDHSTSDHGFFLNLGASHYKGNGGDVAFDGFASGSHGLFHNEPAIAAGGNGGVTSFNNNPPKMDSVGASAGHGFYHNFGAKESSHGGGGHTEFTAKWGSPTAHRATIINYGSVLESPSTAGHTIFSVNLPSAYFPSAGEATVINYPAVLKGSAAGYTEFAIWGQGDPGKNVPTADLATFLNFGGTVHGAAGGYISFSQTCGAGKAKLIAYGGINGGLGGKIIFADQSAGEEASIHLFGNGILDLSKRTEPLKFKNLTLNEGIIQVSLGAHDTGLELSDALIIPSLKTRFSFLGNSANPITKGKKYRVLTCPNLDSFEPSRFEGDAPDGLVPSFSIEKNSLFVSFS